MGETPPDVVREIENVMRRKLETVVQQEYQAAGGVKSLAEILNHTDRPTERNVLDTLGSEDGELAEEVRRLLAAYREKEDLIAIGAYQRGSDPEVDAAIALRPAIERFLRQAVDERTTAADADRALLAIAAAVAEHAGGAAEEPVVDAEPVVGASELGAPAFVPPGGAPPPAPAPGGLGTPAPSTAIPPLNLAV